MIYCLSGFLIQFFYFLPETLARYAVAGFTVEGLPGAKHLLVTILRECKLSLVFQVVYNGLNFADDVRSVNLTESFIVVPVVADHVVGIQFVVLILESLVPSFYHAANLYFCKPVKISRFVIAGRAAGLNGNIYRRVAKPDSFSIL